MRPTLIGAALTVAIGLSGSVTGTPLAQNLFRFPDPGLAAFERRDFKTAVSIWLPRARAGDARAQTWMGVLHIGGLGVAEDPAEARRWFTLAAGQGYPEAHYRLGVIHDFGNGVPVDRRRAVAHYREAAERGHVAAQIALSERYYLGVGVRLDLVRAFMWADIAAGLAQELAERYAAEGNRETAAEMMSPDEIGTARRLAGDWRDRHGGN